jgi:hypothetical protein
MPGKVNELRLQLHQWRTSVGATMPTPNPNYDPAAPRNGGAKRPRRGQARANESSAGSFAGGVPLDFLDD